jgi:hypothetical protein
MISLSKQHIATIKDAAKKLTGAIRREFQAQVSIDYLNSKPHLAEKIFGWDRKTVVLGLNELRSGVVCIDDFKARGNKKTEEKMLELENDIISLAEPESQIDPKFQTAFKYTRITAKAMREALITKKAGTMKNSPVKRPLAIF